jgi:hypothetical protein
MISRIATIALSAVLLLSAVPANAQRRDEEIMRLHYECDHGDRAACVRFGIKLGENRDRHEEWRHTHPEFFWWDRH